MSATEHRHKGRQDGSPSGNRILARLGASDRARIAPDLEEVALEFKETLYEQDRPITQRDRLIRYARGQIEITDGAGLERAACECYAHVRDEFGGIFDGFR